MPSRHSARLRLAVFAAAVSVAATLLAACTSGGATEAAQHPGNAPDSSAPVQIEVNVERGATVPVDHRVRVRVDGGQLDDVRLRSADGVVIKGETKGDGARWRAGELLEPGTTYVFSSTAHNEAGEERKVRRRFQTQELTLDQQIYPSVAPLDGETVGVGMPVIVSFDLPVTDRASIEKHLTVSSTPKQRGAWHWLSDTEVHWRPVRYWKAGTEVRVDLDINSVPAGDGRYGQESRTLAFDVGRKHVYEVDAVTHQMKVFEDDELTHTFPITLGKAGFVTRSGTKVIMEKSRQRRMSSETIGIPAGSAEAYDIDNVEYAMRLTHSGEFIHAAPWSVGSQGSANVSHGCTGMSTADAAVLYGMTLRGDVVEYTGTDRPMTLDNGYGDWNVGFKEWQQGSALAN